MPRAEIAPAEIAPAENVTAEIAPTRIAQPEPAQTELIPARMLNEFAYCPRLCYLEWVQGEFAHSEDTLDGRFQHRRVDRPSGNLPDADDADDTVIHARSVLLSDEGLGAIARIDLVEAQGRRATPVDYKRGAVPNVPEGAYEPERVQLCVQGLLLRAHGYECEEGILYFVASKRRVRVPFDDRLVERTRELMRGAHAMSAQSEIPPPLEDSPKCPRCSLVGICLPDEVAFLKGSAYVIKPDDVRRLMPARERRAADVCSGAGRDGRQVRRQHHGEGQGQGRLEDPDAGCVPACRYSATRRSPRRRRESFSIGGYPSATSPMADG